MRDEQLDVKVLTTMNDATNPTDRSELRDKLETARFEEILYWEGRKDSHLRLIVFLLLLILVAMTLQLLMPFLLADKPSHDRPVPQYTNRLNDLLARPVMRGTR